MPEPFKVGYASKELKVYETQLGDLPECKGIHERHL